MIDALINEENEEKLEVVFDKFLKKQGWNGTDKIKFTYTFYHIINMINQNIQLTEEHKDININSDLAEIRASILDEAIAAIRKCETNSNNKNHINRDLAVGTLISLK